MCYYKIQQPQNHDVKSLQLLEQLLANNGKSIEKKGILLPHSPKDDTNKEIANKDQNQNADFILTLRNILNPISNVNNSLPNKSITLNNSPGISNSFSLFSKFKQNSPQQNTFNTSFQNLSPSILSTQSNLYSQIDLEKTLQENILKLLNENFLLINQINESINRHTVALVHTADQANLLKKDIMDRQAIMKPNSITPNLIQLNELKVDDTCTNYNPSPLNLFTHLCGSSSNYIYKLVLDNELPKPLFRERNLKLKISLIDITTNKPVQNHGKIFLQMTMHTWQIPSTIITRNKNGNKIVQGEVECELKNGQALFDKIQINEVTSKFINGYVCLLICPKRPNNFGTSLDELEKQKDCYGYESVKPLMIEKVIVKSKKKKCLASKKPELKNVYLSPDDQDYQRKKVQ